MKLGEIIKQRRLEKKMTQTELASKIGVSKEAISKLERNLRNGIYQKNIQKIADALGIPTKDVVDAYIETVKERLK